LKATPIQALGHVFYGLQNTLLRATELCLKHRFFLWPNYLTRATSQLRTCSLIRPTSRTACQPIYKDKCPAPAKPRNAEFSLPATFFSSPSLGQVTRNSTWTGVLPLLIHGTLHYALFKSFFTSQPESKTAHLPNSPTARPTAGLPLAYPAKPLACLTAELPALG
jgi:hypothetical protein